MKKQHVLYDAIIGLLTHIASSPDTDTFEGSPEAVAQNLKYASITSSLRNKIASIVQAKAEKNLTVPLAEIYTLMDDFCTRFPSYPSINRTKFTLLLTVAQRICQEGVEIDDDDIDENAFTLVPLPEKVEQLFYNYTNITSFQDSVVVFETTALPELRKILLDDKTVFSIKLLYHFLSRIALDGFAHPGTIAMVRQHSPQITPHSALAFLRLSLVADGKPIHRPRTYKLKPNVARRELIAATTDYRQHVDVIEVLSEYNTRDDLLTKYLTVYHVFENFMCKLPIVELQAQHCGRQISIRDFRSLSQSILHKEMDTLEHLFKKLVSEKPDGTDDFAFDFFKRWSTYLGVVGTLEVDRVLEELNLKHEKVALKASHITRRNMKTILVKIIYQLRNAIVHNKEVDVHVTGASMSIALERLIADVALPSLERLCFHLLFTKNGHVWYDAQNLLLYK